MLSDRKKKTLRRLLRFSAAAVPICAGIRRLRIHRRLREAPPGPPEEAGWTKDGYIRDQDALSRYSYRTIPASNNSCGPVAAFNLRHHAGQEVRFEDVLSEMEKMHLLHIPGPTHMYVMRRYLQKYLPGYREVRGKAACLAAARTSRMGIFRYSEQKVPHFVSYVRSGDGTFRFFNVSDGVEDKTLTMEQISEEHLRGGRVRLLYWT